MKLLKSLLATAFFLSISNHALLAKEPPVVIVSPQENTLAHEETLSVVLKVNIKEVDTIELRTSLEQKQLDINSSKAFYCKTLLLSLGENKIAIRSYKNGILINEQIRHLYVTSPIYQAYKYPPIEYKRQFFHTNKNEAACKSCHDMSVNEKKDIAFIDVTESNCYGCHNKLTKEKYAHAPAVNWLCTSCHNGDVGTDNEKLKGRSKYLVSEPVNKLCFRCHKENFKLWKSYRYQHDPLDSGRCNKCHNSHASPYKMFVRKPVNQICLGCHKDKHIKAKQKGSACEGTSDGKHCIKCHTPHATNKKFLLKEKPEKEKLIKEKLKKEMK